jgi:5-methylcytosine-specific restriction endonuclease McrA
MKRLSTSYPEFKRNFVGPKLTRKQRILLMPSMPANKEEISVFFVGQKYKKKTASTIKQKKKVAKGKRLYKDLTPEEKAKHVNRVRLRQEKIKQATPGWANLDVILAYYIVCQNMTKLEGIKYEVDHIIPIQHPLVCGLHVENNLQIITEEENISKSNKFDLDQLIQY